MPFIKGLPVTLRACENVNNRYRETLMRKTYKDPYTLELKALYTLAMDGTPVKTTADDTKNDAKPFQIIIEHELESDRASQ